MKTFLNLTSSEWKEFGKDALIRLGVGIPAVVLIALLGSSLSVPWLVIPVTPIVTALAGYLITKSDDAKTRRNAVIGFGVIGLIFGILAFIAI